MTLQIKGIQRLCSHFASKRSLFSFKIQNVVAEKRYFSLQNIPNYGLGHQKQLKVLSSLCCHTPPKRQKHSTMLHHDPNEWVTIYRFKQVITARLIQKLKIYQTALSCGVITPITLWSFAHETIDADIAAIALGGSVFACGMLFIMGKISSGVIGFMYTSKIDPTVLKISRLDFWGNRDNDIFPIKDFVPISDLFMHPRERFVSLQRYSEEKSFFYVSLQYGIIPNIDEFERVFGALPPELRETIISRSELKS